MGLVRTIVERGPVGCGAENPVTWQDHLLELFDAEIQGRSKVNARKPGVRARVRMEVGRCLHGAVGVDHDAVDVWFDALVFVAECIDLNKQGLPLTPELKEDKAALLVAAEIYPEVVTKAEVEALSVAAKWE